MSAAIEPTDIGPAMAALANDRQRLFVTLYVAEYDKGGNRAASVARKAGYGTSDSSALTMTKLAYRLLQDHKIVAAILEVSWKHLGSLAPTFVRTLSEVVTDPKARNADKIKACLGGLDRLYPAQLQVQHQHHHVHELDHTAAAVEALRWMRSMDVPRTKLIEQFGESGLSRYSKILDAEDLDAMARAKLIEAREVA